MGAKRIVVCLDMDGTGVVKGVRFRSLRRVGEPVAMARRYERDGADELVLLKVDAHRGHPLSPRVVRAVSRDLSIPLTVGGGIGTVTQAEELLGAGADRVSFNSLAVERPGVLTEAMERFGRQAVVLAIDGQRDAARVPRVHVRGGSAALARPVMSWGREGARRGAGEILLTSIDFDGTRRGFDLPLLRAMRRSVRVPIMASGGAENPHSFLEAFRNGADAALAAGIFHDRVTSVGEVKEYLAARGIEVRR